MSSCGCSSSCKCGDNCSCKRSELSYLVSAKPLVLGVAPMKENFEEFEMGAGVQVQEGGCKCGDDCACNPCNCK